MNSEEHLNTIQESASIYPVGNIGIVSFLDINVTRDGSRTFSLADPTKPITIYWGFEGVIL